MCLSLSQYHNWLDYCGFVISLKSCSISSLSWFLIFKIVSSLLGLLYFHILFRINLWISIVCIYSVFLCSVFVYLSSLYLRANYIISYFLYFFKNIFYYCFLFLAVQGLCCHAWAFSSCGEQGLLCICGGRASHCVAPLLWSMGFRAHCLSCCGARA